MNINEAIHIAEQEKNKFQAFEKVGEVLTLAAQAENTVVEKLREKVGLMVEIKRLLEKESSLKKKESAVDEAILATNIRFGKSTAAMQTDFDRRNSEAEQKHSDLLGKLSDVESKAKEEYGLRIKGLEKHEKDLQGRVDGLQKSLNSLLERAGRVA